MSKTETELRKPVVSLLRASGAMVIPYVGSTMGRSGVSDVHIVSRLFNGYVEFKGPETPRQADQEQFVRDCLKRGYPAVFFRLMESRWSKQKQKGFYTGQFEWQSRVEDKLRWWEYTISGSHGVTLLQQLSTWWEVYGSLVQL